MGFFNKIFGGKKSKSQEIKTEESQNEPVQESKQETETSEPAPEENKSQTSEPAPDEESRVEISGEIPVVSSAVTDGSGEHKSTVFGMPAPLIPISKDDDDDDDDDDQNDENNRSDNEQQQEADSSSSETSEESAPEEQSAISGSMEVSGEISMPSAENEDLTEKMETLPEQEEQKQEEHPEEVQSDDVSPEPASKTPEYVPADITLEQEKIKDTSSHINCSSCGRQLPVPYIGYPAKITCPFCLTVNNYNQN